MAAAICLVRRIVTSNVAALPACWRYFCSSTASGLPTREYYLDGYYDWDLEAQSHPRSFGDLHVQADVSKTLRTQWNIAAPTDVQRRSLPLTMTRKTCLIQSPTGSGKTLCYLLPAVQDRGPGLSSLVLVPTRELAQQVYHCASVLSGRRGRRKSGNIRLLVTGYEEVEDPYDVDEEGEGGEEEKRVGSDDGASTGAASIVIGTPKRVLEEVRKKALDFQYLRRVVLDECDKLFLSGEKKGGAWKRERIRERNPRATSLILRAIQEQFKGKPPQLICTSATAKCGVQEDLAKLEWTPPPREIICSTIRQIPSNIRHCYVSLQLLGCPSRNPVEVLADLIKQSNEPSSLVFIHRGAKIDRFVHQLRTQGLRTVALYEKTVHRGDFADFLEMFRSGEIQVAVGTEETVRGLDFPWVRSVYLTEVPRKVEEYVHLCGRVGRLNQAGRAVVLVPNPDKDLARMLRYFSKVGVEGTEIRLPGSPTAAAAEDEEE